MPIWLQLFDAVFGCRHTFSLPITAINGNPRRRRTYVVCLECGVEFDYDWQAMRVGRRSRQTGGLSLMTRKTP